MFVVCCRFGWELITVTTIEPASVAFRAAALRIGESPTVHAVSWVEDERATELPVPACRQGWFATSGRLHPVRSQEVTCRRCLALSPGMMSRAAPYSPRGGQMILDLPEIPDLPSFPPPGS